MNRVAEGDVTSRGGGLAADQALHWFVRLRSGAASSAERQSFDLWFHGDRRHREEFEQCVRLWGELDAAKPLLREELENVADDWERAGRFSVRGRGWGIGWGWRRACFSAVLGTFLATLIIGGWWFGAGVEMVEYQTAKGERRTVFLPDGSTVTMNTDTAVAVEFTPARRAVIVREGEALVAVAHGDKRRFDVLSGGRVIRDIGTQFVVRRQDRSVRVTVVEGAVEVQRFEEGALDQSWQVLMAGQQLSYGPQGPLSQISPASPAVATAWIDGKIVFEDRLLSDVLQEVGRYHAGEIRILDPHVASLKVSGTFSVRDREGFLAALERALPVAASRVTAELVVLEARTNVLPER
ncbi:MAG: FecR family protein [Nitrospira sp.]|nr:FecR family protein [Nitrospira sp.]